MGKTKEVTSRTNMCTIQEGSLRSLKQLRQLSVFPMGGETKQQIWGSCNAFIFKCPQQNMKALFFSKEREKIILPFVANRIHGDLIYHQVLRIRSNLIE